MVVDNTDAELLPEIISIKALKGLISVPTSRDKERLNH